MSKSKLNFRILDLLLITGAISVIFGAFNNDVLLFRQLLFLSIVGVVSRLGCAIFPKWNAPILKAAIAGSLGGLIYVGIAFIFMFEFYTSLDRFLIPPQIAGNIVMGPWLLELSFGPAIAAGLGAAIGPLWRTHLDPVELPSHFKTQRAISWMILGAAVVVLFLAANDRIVVGNSRRNWTAILPLFFLIFVVQSIHWMLQWNRELARGPENSTQSDESEIESIAETATK